MALWDPVAAGNAAIYLRLPDNELFDIRMAEFEGKTAVWVPYSETGYTKGKKIGEAGGKIKVERLVDGKEKEYKPEQVEPQNPPKYELIEDLANMTYLSEASVVHNLSERYVRFLIYTYSGLFCVTVNPYKWLPVYDNHVVGCYKNKRKTEMPPHVYSVSDNAYNDMLRNRENQSMLITGESGAGKTVNTKRVIQYFALVAATGGDSGGSSALKGGGTLEDQIVAANPAMEAYGNAKTIRNDNSSRFGKFIRIHFNMHGVLASGDIDTYLLEKSRVSFQLKAERCFHIFYQICTGHKPEINEMCGISTDPYDYKWCSLGEIKVKSIDDTVELEATDESFDILGFDQTEKDAIYKITAAIMHSGNVGFKNKPREEQAEADDDVRSKNSTAEVARLFGIDGDEYIKAMCNPRVKVGTEYVTKGQTVQQCEYALAALTKAAFGRLFDWLVKVINRALATDMPRDFFIGILDIAGFEIFEFNTFEQLCINYTNERLQQFFNHHMFILEQEEYKREGIDWVFQDFGMDLQASLDLIEKPLGIMSMLEEECLVPKGTDMTYKEKLLKQHTGKSKAFGKIKKQGKIEAHFELYHYAGTVQYNVCDWLLKNKDPLNNSVVMLYKNSSIDVVQTIWETYVSPDDAGKGGKGGKGGKRQKGGSFQTVSALHRESLNRLLTNLRATQPHFIRCIIPNEIKKPGYMENNLVLHQLRCNGVLEGIRICRKGFPSRVVYNEWRARYNILNPSAVPKGVFMDDKKACEKILGSIVSEVDPEVYRFGHTKLFFKAGIIGALEDLRDERIAHIITMLQNKYRCDTSRARFLRIRSERDGAKILQQNWRSFQRLKDWPWQQLFFKIKPLLNIAEKREQMEKMKTDYEGMAKELIEEKAAREALDKKLRDMINSVKNAGQRQSEDSQAVVELESQLASLQETKILLEDKVRELQERLEDDEELNVDVMQKKEKLIKFVKEQKTLSAALRAKLTKMEEERDSDTAAARGYEDKLRDLQALMEQLIRDTTNLEELRFKNVKLLQEKEAVQKGVTDQNSRLQEQADSAELDYELERKSREDVEKQFKKMEGELRMNNETIMDINSDKERLGDILRKADEEYNNLNDKYEDALTSVCQFTAKIKDFTKSNDKLEEQCDLERSERAKSEREKNELESEYKAQRELLNEQLTATQKQSELNKKLTIDIQKLGRDLDEKQIGLTSALDGLRKKFADTHADTIHEVSELEKHNQKLERETAAYQEQANDFKQRVRDINAAKADNERLVNNLDDENKALKQKCLRDDHNLTEALSNKARMITEISELKRTLNEKDSVQQILFRNKTNMLTQQESLRKQIEEQIKQKQGLAINLSRSKSDHAQLEDQYSTEVESKKEVQRQYDTSLQDVTVWKYKYENDAAAKTSELESDKKGLTARVSESEQTLQNSLNRTTNLEKSKSRLQQEIKDISVELDRALAAVSNTEKKQRAFDKILAEEDCKFDRIGMRLKEVLEERKAEVHLVFKARQRLEEVEEELETNTKDHKILVEEVADLKDQIKEGSKSASEINKAKSYIEKDRNELHKTLNQKEDQLEQLMAKTILFQLNYKKCKSDMDEMVVKKDAEDHQIRKNAHETVISIQTKLEEEIRLRSDVVKTKKKTESHIDDLEQQVSSATNHLHVLTKHNKEVMISVKEKQMELEQNERIATEVGEQRITMERRMNICDVEVEELREAVDKAEKLKKNAQAKLQEAKEAAGLMTSQNTALHNQKRKLELQLQMIANEVEESFEEAKIAMEKSKKANYECAQLGEEYKKAHDQTEFIQKTKATLDAEVQNLQDRLVEQEEFNQKGGKRTIARLQDDIRDLESKVENKRKENEDMTKNLKKMERKAKEAVMVLEEDKKFLSKQQEEYESNQIKLRKMKREFEEIESAVMKFNSKGRKLAQDLLDVEEKVEHAETTLDIIWGK